MAVLVKFMTISGAEQLHATDDCTTVDEFLEEQGIDPDDVVIYLNDEVVDGSQELDDQDIVRIVKKKQISGV